MFFKKTNLNFQKATTVFGYEMENIKKSKGFATESVTCRCVIKELRQKVFQKKF